MKTKMAAGQGAMSHNQHDNKEEWNYIITCLYTSLDAKNLIFVLLSISPVSKICTFINANFQSF